MRADLPASHTELVSGDDEVVDMGSTSHNAPTHGESGCGTMGAVGAASHDDLSTWVEGSGASASPALGPRRCYWSSTWGAPHFNPGLDGTINSTSAVCILVVFIGS